MPMTGYARLTKGQRLGSGTSRVLPCPKCGDLSMKRVRGPCTLQERTVVPDLERFQCSRCRANFFDEAAMRTIAEYRRHSSRKVLMAGGARSLSEKTPFEPAQS